MKKIFLVLMMVLMMFIIPQNEVSATESSPFDIEQVTLPRFAYNTYEAASGNVYTNTTVGFKISTQIPNEVPDRLSFELVLQQVDYNGNVIKTLGYDDVTLSADGTVYSSTASFPYLTKILWNTDLVFYRVMYDQVIIYSGSIMLNPNTENYSPVGTAEVFLEEELTNNKDKYQVLHYRFNTDIEVQGQELYIHFRDMYDGLIKDSISTDILNVLQISVLTSSVQNRNAYLIIDLDGGSPPALRTDYTLLEDMMEQYMNFTFDPSVYLIEVSTNADFIITLADTLWIKAIEENAAFNLTLSTIIPDEGTTMYVDFNKLEEPIYRCYETVIASDNSNNYFNQDDIEASPISVNFSYKINTDTLDIGDTAIVNWILYPQNVVISGGNPADYKIDLSLSYTRVETGDAIDSLTGSFGFWGLTDGEGGLVLTLFLVIIVNIGLLMIGVRSGIGFVLANLMVLIISAVIGLLEIWFILGFAALLVFGFILLNAGGE